MKFVEFWLTDADLYACLAARGRNSFSRVVFDHRESFHL